MIKYMKVAEKTTCRRRELNPHLPHYACMFYHWANAAVILPNIFLDICVCVLNLAFGVLPSCTCSHGSAIFKSTCVIPLSMMHDGTPFFQWENPLFQLGTFSWASLFRSCFKAKLLTRQASLVSFAFMHEYSSFAFNYFSGLASSHVLSLHT